MSEVSAIRVTREATDAVTILNTGTIQGGWLSFPMVINGDIDLGAGDDAYFGRSGEHTGSASGGEGNDTITDFGLGGDGLVLSSSL